MLYTAVIMARTTLPLTNITALTNPLTHLLGGQQSGLETVCKDMRHVSTKSLQTLTINVHGRPGSQVDDISK